MITSKENKISEFRREWIGELRDQIAIFSSSFQNLVLLGLNKNTVQGDLTPLRKDAIESLAKITLMINNQDAKEKTTSPEYLLNQHLEKAREMLSSITNKEGKYTYQHAVDLSISLRNDSQILLKDNWNIVKSGEPSYKFLKITTQIAYFIVLPIVTIISIIYFVSALNNLNQVTKGMLQATSKFDELIQKDINKDLP